MNREIIRQIDRMRLDGSTPTAMARKLGISVNTVKSHIRRHPVIPGTLPCVCCGRPVLQNAGRKAKKYCSDRCRITYWNHRYREDTDGKQ